MKKLVLLTIIWVVTFKSFGQSICQTLPQNAVSGNFEIVGNINSGCSPLLINLIDNSGGINIKYDFYYNGQPPSQLKKTGNDDLSNVYFSSSDVKVFTILQYGEKNGKPMYACKNITILPNNKPKYTYSICSSQLEIAIPQASENNFDSYKVNWGSGNTEVTVQANQLPFSASKVVTYPTVINVEGIYSNQANQTCGTNTFTTIQKLDPINFPNGYSPPFDPNIDEIVQKGSNKISLKFRGSEDPTGYTLNMRKIDEVYSSIPFKTNVVPGNLDITLPDSNNIYCFYFTRFSGCGSFEESAEACIVKQQEPKIEAGNINIQWSSYPQAIRDYKTQNNVHTFSKTIEIEKDYNGSKSFVPVASDAINYRDQAECVNNLKYRIKLKIVGLLWSYKYQTTVYSEWKYVDASKIKAPAITDLLITSDNYNKLQLKFEDNANWNTPILKFYIHEISNNMAILQDSVLSAGLINLPDKDAAIKTYCYKINYVDQCGFFSEFSPEVCSIHLKLAANNNLEWSMANPFAMNNLDKMLLESKKDELSSYQNSTILQNNIFFHSPDYTIFMDKVIFRLKASSSNSNYVSYSNSLEVPLKNNIVFPNSFSPNGDGINDEFYPFGNTKTINDYFIQIYDRWGDILFETTNPNEKWSGKNKHGKTYSNGTYFAKISFNTDKNKKEEMKIAFFILH